MDNEKDIKIRNMSGDIIDPLSSYKWDCTMNPLYAISGTYVSDFRMVDRNDTPLSEWVLKKKGNLSRHSRSIQWDLGRISSYELDLTLSDICLQDFYGTSDYYDEDDAWVDEILMNKKKKEIMEYILINKELESY